MAVSKSDICIGTISGAHGVHGAVRVRVYSDDPEGLLRYKKLKDQEGRLFTVKKLRIQKGHTAIVKFEDISDRNEAEGLSNRNLYISRAQMPELENDEFYITDLIDLEVRTLTGEVKGFVVRVENNGAGDYLILSHEPNATLPFTHEAVPEVHVLEGYIVIDESAFIKPEAA